MRHAMQFLREREQARIEADRRRSEREKDLRVLYSEVFGSEAGQAVLCDLLDFCQAAYPSFTGNSETLFNEGVRSVGIYLMDRVGAQVTMPGGQTLKPMKEHTHAE